MLTGFSINYFTKKVFVVIVDELAELAGVDDTICCLVVRTVTVDGAAHARSLHYQPIGGATEGHTTILATWYNTLILINC